MPYQSIQGTVCLVQEDADLVGEPLTAGSAARRRRLAGRLQVAIAVPGRGLTDQGGARQVTALLRVSKPCKRACGSGYTRGAAEARQATRLRQ
jgi:hypothetical protein